MEYFDSLDYKETWHKKIKFEKKFIVEEQKEKNVYKCKKKKTKSEWNEEREKIKH